MTDIDKLRHTLSAMAGHLPSWVVSVGIGAAVSAVLLAALAAIAVRARQGVRNASRNAKSSIGFGAVQAGVAYITITGVYEFFNRLLSMPAAESWLLAGVVESATWAAVGWIYGYGKGVDKDGQPNEGFGPAGPFFWVTVIGGGTLAILGSEANPIATGRIVVVVIGAYMWYLRLLQVTRRSGKPSRWRWTPKRLLLAVGAIEPADEDVENEAREWQIRRMARAMRWANSRWPLSWLGRRGLIRRGEATQEDVIADARRRYAVTHVLVEMVRPDSPVMARVLADVEAGHVAGQADSRTADGADTRTAGTQDAPGSPDMGGQVPAPTTNGHLPAVADRTVVEMSARRHNGGQGRSADTVSVETLADTLGKAFKGERVGAPKARVELIRVYGSCSKERAIAAKDLHNSRRESTTPGSDDSADDKEREAVVSA